MWIHWSVTRLVRWRVRDWASCFTACRFPLDDETDTYQSSLPQQHYDMKNMKGSSSSNNKRDKKLLRRNKWNKKRCARINMDSATQGRRSNRVSSSENTSNNVADDETRWPSFADEDYIVFCFKEDGAFDVVKDCKSEATNHIDCTRRSSWPLTQNEAETDKNSRYDSFRGSDAEIIIDREAEEEEEEDGIFLDAQSPSSIIQREDQIENMGHREMVSAGSSDSYQSDNSTGSFAFPVLGWEWMGSPAQWPKAEGLHLRKNKSRSLTFQCCRF